MRHVEVSPAALGSIALHVAVALALTIQLGGRDLKVGAVVPVTIVSNAPDVDTRPALQAPETQTAMAEEPAPEAPPEPTPPTPQPTPAAPAPKPAKPVEKGLDLDALAASLAKSNSRAASNRPTAAAKGPARPETAPAARNTTGSGLAAGAALRGLAEELQRRWNPNCDVEGGRDVIVLVRFTLGAGGQVVGQVRPEIQGARTPAAQAGAERAVRAVYAASPFRSLPREFYGERITVNFDARTACANQ